MVHFKVAKYFWDFLWEILIGKNVSFRQALSNHKVKLFFFLSLFGSVYLNINVISTLTRVTHNHVILKQEHEKIEKELVQSEEAKARAEARLNRLKRGKEATQEIHDEVEEISK